MPFDKGGNLRSLIFPFFSHQELKFCLVHWKESGGKGSLLGSFYGKGKGNGLMAIPSTTMITVAVAVAAVATCHGCQSPLLPVPLLPPVTYTTTATTKGSTGHFFLILCLPELTYHLWIEWSIHSNF